MAITQTINLNMIPDSAPVVVRCDQYDTGTGRIIAKLYNGATEYTPGAGATAVIQGTKPDNTAFSYAATISGNTVTADLTQQMSAVYGAVRCQFVVTETSGRTGTFVFVLRVQQSALEDTADISETEIPAIIDAAEHNAERAEEAVEHYPYIDNTTKHWFVWDVENEEWYDTGVNAYGSVTQGNGIKIINGVISVDADTTPTKDSTKPVISGGEYTTAVGGYQLVKDTVGWTGKNLLIPENYPSSTGMFTFNSDYTYTVNGSSGSTNKQIIIPITGLDGDFYFTGCPSGGSADKYDLYAWDNTTNARCKKWDGTTNSESDFGGTLQEVKLDSTHNIVLTLRVKANMTVSNIVFKPMLIRKDILDPTFEPPHAPVSQTKADNSVIAPVEDGDKYSTSYSAYKVFIRGGKLCRTKIAVTSADTPTLNTNYVEEPDVASDLNITETTASLIENELGITLDGTVKYIKKCGKLVQVYCRFNSSTAQTVPALTSVINTGYPPLIDGTKLNVITRAAPYAPAAFSAHVTPTGTIALPKDAVLGAQGYDIYGMFLTK